MLNVVDRLAVGVIKAELVHCLHDGVDARALAERDPVYQVYEAVFHPSSYVYSRVADAALTVGDRIVVSALPLSYFLFRGGVQGPVG